LFAKRRFIPAFTVAAIHASIPREFSELHVSALNRNLVARRCAGTYIPDVPAASDRVITARLRINYQKPVQAL
jgi:hypothetical protein